MSFLALSLSSILIVVFISWDEEVNRDTGGGVSVSAVDSLFEERSAVTESTWVVAVAMEVFTCFVFSVDDIGGNRGELFIGISMEFLLVGVAEATTDDTILFGSTESAVFPFVREPNLERKKYSCGSGGKVLGGNDGRLGDVRIASK